MPSPSISFRNFVDARMAFPLSECDAFARDFRMPPLPDAMERAYIGSRIRYCPAGAGSLRAPRAISATNLSATVAE